MKKIVEIKIPIDDLKKIVDGVKAFDLIKVPEDVAKKIDEDARKRINELAKETLEKEGIEVPEDIKEILVEWYKYLMAKVIYGGEND